MIEFPISGVETYWWFPVVVAFVVSMIASVGGLSGAFLLLPFQVSILGFVGPAVSSTNLMFNILAIPSGVYRHCREKRMIWQLAGLIILGSTPGILIGAFIRMRYLPTAGPFKIFAGLVLLYLAFKLFYDLFFKKGKNVKGKPTMLHIDNLTVGMKSLDYNFDNQSVSIPTIPLILLSLAVGIVGGAYGIGGGAIIVPFLVARYNVPVHTLAGAALFSTFAASIIGVLSYIAVSYFIGGDRPLVSPDFLLAGLLGIGGFFGIYVGSRIQKYLPSRIIKLTIAVCMLFISFKYIFLR